MKTYINAELTFLLLIICMLSSCAAQISQPRHVTANEFISAIKDRAKLSDSCRPIYCAYFIMEEGDTLRFAKRELGRRIIVNIQIHKNELDSVQMQQVMSIGHFGEIIELSGTEK